MNSKITLGMIIAFILKYRDEWVFRGAGVNGIANNIQDNINRKTLIVATDEHDNVVGVVTGIVDTQSHIYHVDNILSSADWVLVQFVREFQSRWPNYNLRAFRRNRLVNYNTGRFIKKVLHI